jgi:hypothetical protein
MPERFNPAPDPTYVAEQRGLFVDLCTLLGAHNAYGTTEPGDYDEDGNGGLLLRQLPTVWRPVESCRDLAALADEAYRTEADR